MKPDMAEMLRAKFRRIRRQALGVQRSLHIGSRVKALALFGGALVVLAGCSQPGPVRAPITGKVTVGGQPLAAGRILFTPIAPNSGPATSAAIVSGQYTIPASEGPVVGLNRVEVEAQLNLGFPIDDEAAFAKRGGKPLPPNPIPPQYNRDSQLTVEVQRGSDNQFDVEVPKSRHFAARPAY